MNPGFQTASKLTDAAIQNFKPGELVVEAILTADGKIKDLVFRGHLKNGISARVSAAIREIKFTPAILDGKYVSQRVRIKNGIKKCENGQICTYAFEIIDLY